MFPLKSCLKLSQWEYPQCDPLCNVDRANKRHLLNLTQIKQNKGLTTEVMCLSVYSRSTEGMKLLYLDIKDQIIVVSKRFHFKWINECLFFSTLLHCTNCVVVLPKGGSMCVTDMTNQKANSYLTSSFGWSAKNTDLAYECILFK